MSATLASFRRLTVAMALADRLDQQAIDKAGVKTCVDAPVGGGRF